MHHRQLKFIHEKLDADKHGSRSQQELYHHVETHELAGAVAELKGGRRPAPDVLTPWTEGLY